MAAVPLPTAEKVTSRRLRQYPLSASVPIEMMPSACMNTAVDLTYILV